MCPECNGEGCYGCNPQCDRKSFEEKQTDEEWSSDYPPADK